MQSFIMICFFVDLRNVFFNQKSPKSHMHICAHNRSIENFIFIVKSMSLQSGVSVVNSELLTHMIMRQLCMLMFCMNIDT